MLIEEKRKNNIIWYKDDERLYRVKCEGDKATVWVNLNGYNIAMPMLMWDFFVEMEENGIALKLDSQWNGHNGFVINKDDILYFIGLVEIFIDERDANSMLLSEKYLEDWYD